MRRSNRVLLADEIFLVLQAAAVIGIIYARSGLLVGVSLAIGLLGSVSFVAGIVGRIAFEAARRRLSDYARAIASREWIVTTIRTAIVGLFGTAYVYTALKVHVPLLNARLYDRQLWEIDRALFFGISPNVFFLNVFDNKAFMVFVDRVYGYLFLSLVLLSAPVLLSLISNSIRVAFITGQVLLWSAGAWLYLAFPSLGPCYVYYAVWDPFRARFAESAHWQAALFRNYTLVLRVRDGVVSPNIDLAEGIGAFPSLHVAFVVYLTLWLFRWRRWAGVAGIVVSAIMFIGSVLTGWHYLVDSIAGVLLAAICWWISLRVERNIAQEPDGARTA